MSYQLRALFGALIALSLMGCESTSFSEYESLQNHKALAVGSNGVIAYSSSKSSVEDAITEALNNCSSNGGVSCKFINIDGYSPMVSKTYMYDGRAASVGYLQRAPYRVKYKCSNLTRAMAQSLYQAGHTYLDRDSDGKPCESKSLSELYSNSFGSNVKGSSCHHVRGYTRKDGTYVRVSAPM